MAIKEHPAKGTILMCNFDQGFKIPEMVKRRPVIVVSPKILARPGLCTVVALSTTPPDPIMPYHAKIDLPQTLPKRLRSSETWVKGDMINTVGLHRLDFIRLGKTKDGKRIYHYSPLDAGTMERIEGCILHALGLSNLTKHL